MNCSFILHSYCRQHSIMYRATKVVLSLIILFMGGLIYVVYRDKSLLMFDWFDYLGISNAVEGFRNLFQVESVYGWVKYSLPDGLWIFSYMFIVDAIWDKEKNTVSMIFLWGLPIVAVLSECFQYFGLLPGVFDWMDMASYLFAIALFLIIKLLK